MPKDIVSSESKPHPKPWSEQSMLERVATGVTTGARAVVDTLRSPLTSYAKGKIKEVTFGGLTSRPMLPPPHLDDTAIPRQLAPNNKNHDQLQADHFNFTPNGGQAQTIDGWHLQAQPGKPTVVFFGGSNMDRSSPEYQRDIRNMAFAAKEKGMGFVVFDYPSGSNEQVISEYVAHLQTHMEKSMGIPKHMQAYSGYSMGSYAASHAANINPEAAGLQIVSGFSSARMVAKEGMGMAGILVNRGDLTSTVMDTANECRGVKSRLDNQDPSAPKMPLAVVYSPSEHFGTVGNRHIDPVIHELGGPGNAEVSQALATIGHLEMLNSGAHLTSFTNFVANVQDHIGAVQQFAQQQSQVPDRLIIDMSQVPEQGMGHGQEQGQGRHEVIPQDPMPKIIVRMDDTEEESGPTVRPRTNSVRDVIHGNGSTSIGVKQDDDPTALTVKPGSLRGDPQFKRASSKSDLSQSSGFSI